MGKSTRTKLTHRMPTRTKQPPRSEEAFWVRRADKERAVYGCVSSWTQSEVKASRRSLGLPSSPYAKSASTKKVLKARPALRRLMART